MSRSRYFGSLNPNLEELFGSRPLGAFTGGGGEDVFLLFGQYHRARCLGGGYLGADSKSERIFGTHPPGGVNRGGGERR